MPQKISLTECEAVLLRRLAGGGDPLKTTSNSVAVAALYNLGLIDIRSVYTINERGAAALRALQTEGAKA
jgi:hypothetical protein